MTRPTHCLVCLAPLPRRPWWRAWFPPLPLHTRGDVDACRARQRRLVGAA